ncbi:hypothetical protein F511_33910 [Dorcoceras hygrometricum]|uniref:Uncharacterized protein n=1 Tax=Dorcoceras hygrometricum TaxID=472368 RepID=A0A2Z7A7U2_9LAMI|nr:hypothetical protein F511_33910 [Dorcoceras hygrometricum]
MRELRVTSCWFGKTVEEVERRRFVKMKRCVLEPSARGFKTSNKLSRESSGGSSVQATIQRVRDLERFRAIDLLPKLRTKTPDFVLPYFPEDFEKFSSHSNSACTDFCCRYMGLRNISDYGLLRVTNGLDPLEEQNLGTDQ